MRERAAQIASSKKKAQAKKEKKQKKDELKKAEDDVNELPEVDQNTKKDLRVRTSATTSPKSKKN